MTTEHSSSNPDSAQASTGDNAGNAAHPHCQHGRKRHRRGFFRLALFGAIVGFVVYQGIAHAGGFGGCHGGRGRFEGMMLHHLEDVLEDVDATEAQTQTVTNEAKAFMDAMKQNRATHDQMHQRLADLLTAETLDAQAIEAARQEMLAHVDATSQLASKHLLAAASALDVEQRKQIVAEIQERHGHHDD